MKMRKEMKKMRRRQEESEQEERWRKTKRKRDPLKDSIEDARNRDGDHTRRTIAADSKQ